MQDEHRSMQENGWHTASQGTESLIECLRDPYEPSHEKLKYIVEFVIQFPEPQRALAMTKIAEHLVNSMSLHFLDIMATFQRKAEQEGIDQEEREGTFQDILSELFPIMMDLSRNISVQSLDDLLALSNITFGLYRLSQVDSAERAQRWLYKLPKLYRSQLAQEHLVTSVQAYQAIA